VPEPNQHPWNRDDQQKPGRPPRSKTEPAGAQATPQGHKTATDPQSGEPINKAPAPNQARSDQTDGVPGRGARS